MPIKIIVTEDGSHSLFDDELNEAYHSIRGAKGESMHVFVKNGLDHWLAQNSDRKTRVLEVGFGTGLNAFLTAKAADNCEQKIHFTSIEPYPIERDVYARLNFAENDREIELLSTIHESSWEKEVAITPYFELHKTSTKLEDFNTFETFNIIYFDAFAPSKQPEVWSPENLKKCYNLLSSGGLLTTYCAQGQFKRNLAKVGFRVQTLQGAMGKKEMVRAIK
ncbi:MAG: tRNA (5-methylaminomethyl-2-thiouridine)(34)-methyltransferase MnmD [Bacteroidota bacterium]